MKRERSLAVDVMIVAAMISVIMTFYLNALNARDEKADKAAAEIGRMSAEEVNSKWEETE